MSITVTKLTDKPITVTLFGGPPGLRGDTGVVDAEAPLVYDAEDRALSLDVPALADALATEGTLVDDADPRLSDARTPTSHTHPASQISDSTSAGRAVLTAADATAQRSALGLGTAATQASTAFAAASHTHPAAQISDSTTVGRALLTASTDAAARAAIDAAQDYIHLTRFIAADGTGIASVAPVVGTALPNSQGTLSILSNRLIGATGVSASICNDVPGDDHVVGGTVYIAGLATSQWTTFYARYVDLSNYLSMMVLEVSGVTRLFTRKVVANVTTNYASVAFPFTAGDTFRVAFRTYRLGGLTYGEVRVNGTLVPALSFADNVLAAAGKAALATSQPSPGMDSTKGYHVESFYVAPRWEPSLSGPAGATGQLSYHAGAGEWAEAPLFRDSANVMAQRNGTSAQALRVYNLYTSAGANYELIALEWSSNVAYLRTQKSGTGVARDLRIALSGTVSLAPASSTAIEINNGTMGTLRDLSVRKLTANGDEVVANVPALAVTQTWNNAAVTFDAVVVDVTNTASAAGSDLIDLRVGGVTQFKAFANGVMAQKTLTVSALPAAATAGAGARAFVADANATTFASIVAGGGANTVPVYSDGTNWRIG